MQLQYANPIHPFLQPDETVLWFSQPRQGYHRNYVANTLLGLLACASFLFGLQWLSGAVQISDLFQDPIRAETIVPVGLVGWVFWARRDAHFRRNIWYAITNRRVVILWGDVNNRVEADQSCYNLSELPPYQMVQRRNGSGSIYFLLSSAEELEMHAWGASAPAGLDFVVRSFVGIDNVSEVEKLLRKQAEMVSGIAVPPPKWERAPTTDTSRFIDQNEQLFWEGRPAVKRNAAEWCWLVLFLVVPAAISTLLWHNFRGRLDPIGTTLCLYALLGVTAMLTYKATFLPLSRRAIYYTITNTRVIIATDKFFRRILSYPLQRIPRVEIVDHGDGLGSVRFALRGPFDSPEDPEKQEVKTDPLHALDRIKDAKMIYGYLHYLRQQQLLIPVTKAVR